MRIVFFTQYFWPEIGAPQVRYASLLRVLRERGHQIEVITAMPNYPEGKIHQGYRGKIYSSEDHDGYRIHRVWLWASMGKGLSRVFSYLSFALMSVLAFLRIRSPDIILVESPPPFLLPFAWFFSRLNSCHFGILIADLWPDSLVELGISSKKSFLVRTLDRIQTFFYQRCDSLTCLTLGLEKILVEEKGVAKSKVIFMPNGVDIDLIDSSLPAEEFFPKEWAGKHILLYPGTIGFIHSLDTAIEAFEILRKDDKDHDFRLAIVGDGSEKNRLVKLVEEKGLANEVRFWSAQPLEKVISIMKAAQFGLVSLKNINSQSLIRSSKIFPMMASGLPVLHCGTGEGAEIIQKSEAGVVISPEDPSGLASGLKQLANSPQAMHRFSKNGKAVAETEFSWALIASDWEKNLESKMRVGKRSGEASK